MNNQLNKKVINLKDLNLISVLNNMDDERLKNIVNNINSLKLFNTVKNAKCNICNKKLCYHDECYFCEKYVCNALYSISRENCACMKCIKDEKIDITHCENDNSGWISVGCYEFRIVNIVLDKKYFQKTEIIISYEGLLKILKDNNIEY